MIRHKQGLREGFSTYAGALPSSVYRKVIQAYYKLVIDNILIHNKPYRFPYLGDIELTKVKPTLRTWEDGTIKPTLPVDWKATKEHGKIIYHMNHEQFGYVFKIRFKKLKFRNNAIFKFKPERYNFKRYLNQLITSEDVKIDAPLLR